MITPPALSDAAAGRYWLAGLTHVGTPHACHWARAVAAQVATATAATSERAKAFRFFTAILTAGEASPGPRDDAGRVRRTNRDPAEPRRPRENAHTAPEGWTPVARERSAMTIGKGGAQFQPCFSARRAGFCRGARRAILRPSRRSRARPRSSPRGARCARSERFHPCNLLRPASLRAPRPCPPPTASRPGSKRWPPGPRTA